MTLLNANLTREEGAPGSLATSRPWGTHSKYADAELVWGLGVVRDGADDKVKHPTAAFTATDFMGIVMKWNVYDPSLTTSGDVPANKEAKICTDGKIRVRVEDAVVEGGKVFCRHTAAGANTTLGAFRSDADTAKATEIPGARYAQSANAGEICVIDLRIES